MPWVWRHATTDKIFPPYFFMSETDAWAWLWFLWGREKWIDRWISIGSWKCSFWLRSLVSGKEKDSDERGRSWTQKYRKWLIENFWGFLVKLSSFRSRWCAEYPAQLSWVMAAAKWFEPLPHYWVVMGSMPSVTDTFSTTWKSCASKHSAKL